MAIGRTFQESLQKALRGLEVGVDGFNLKSVDADKISEATVAIRRRIGSGTSPTRLASA